MKAVLLFLATIICTSCSSQKIKFDKGRLEGNIYSNDYFGFKIKVDTPWHILNMDKLRQMVDERIDMISETGGNGGNYQQHVQEEVDLKEGTNADLAKSAHVLLSLAIDTVEPKVQVLISSLDRALFPQIKKDGDDLAEYVRQVKEMYATYPVEILNSEIVQEKISGRTFYAVLLTIKAENFLAFQKKYTLREGDKLLSILINYNSDISGQKCLDLLRSIKWTN